MYHGDDLWPRSWQQSANNGVSRAVAAAAFILRHNWAIWPPGRGSRCCRILRRRTL